jgi:hypothetical protein
VPVADEPLIGDAPYDYADCFEIQLGASDPRSAEELARCGLDDAPLAVREMIWIVHRYVLQLRLAPRASAGHLRGWTIVTSEPDVVQLEATSPLLGRAVIVLRRLDSTRATFTTHLFFDQAAQARALWTVIGPLHRRAAPGLLEYAAAREPVNDARELVHA